MTMCGRKLGMIIGVIILGGYFGLAWTADLKIGYVDIQRAVNECREGVEAKKALIKEVEKFQRLTSDKQKELQTMKDSLEKQAPMLTPDARAAKEKEIQNKGRESQRWLEDNQNELNQKRAEMEENIRIGVQRVIQKIGADDGYTFILWKNEDLMPYVLKSLDLTDRVIKAYDAQKK
jgi:outer membrane protein